MRVLMVAPQPFFRPRGTPFSILHRIRALLRFGHSVDLVTYPFGESPDLPGLVIHRAARPPAMRDVPVGPSVAKVLLDAPLFVKTYRLARSGRFQLLHTHEEAGAMGAWISRACRIPHLYDMHSSLPEQFANFERFDWPPIVWFFRRLERYTLNGSDGVITICPELRDHVLATGYTGPLTLLENVLDFDVPDIGTGDVRELRDGLGLGTALVVVYTGTLERYQGLDLLIEAAREVTRDLNQVRFVIVGGKRQQIDKLADFAEGKGVRSHFVFVPAVPPEEVFLYQRMADALITTRRLGTNTPLKIYQYLRAGKPIVATRIRSHTQVLDSATAELVSPEASSIAAGIKRVLMEPARAIALAEAAGSLAQERYSEQIYFDRLVDILDQLPVRGRQFSKPKQVDGAGRGSERELRAEHSVSENPGTGE